MSNFFKYHGLGNDYIVIDLNKINFDLLLSKKNIKLICNRNTGIGSDGILLGPIIKNSQVSFRIFNPDGSEAEKSGNGIRIFTLYLLDRGYLKCNKFNLYIGLIKVIVEIIDARANLIKVSMGQYSLLDHTKYSKLDCISILNHKINLFGNREIINCVSIGNPHCVLIKDEVCQDLTLKIGAALEHQSAFTDRINVQFVKILSRSKIKIEIWERGVGYTLSSGTSSCAASCITYILNLTNNIILVNMQGGDVLVELLGQEVFLTGGVSRVFKGTFNKYFIRKLIEI